MIKLDLRTQSVTVEELFRAADSDSVLIVTDGGHEYLLEPAGEFDREVAELGGSDRFMQFLSERRRDVRRISLAEVEGELKPLSE
jgi:hypothetical protein